MLIAIQRKSIPGLKARAATVRSCTIRRSVLDWLLPLTLLISILRLWIMPLGSSLWVDEMGTAFVINHGASDPSLRAAPQVADSIYYLLPAFAVHVAGYSEIALRFFSVLAMAVALCAIWHLTTRLIHPDAAWLAIFGCLALRSFDYQAADARPYALGTCVLALALLLLVRWQQEGRIRDGLLFACAASLLWWIHLIFWPFYLLFGIYIAVCLIRKNSPRDWWQAIAVFGIIAAGCLPAVATALAILREARAHVVVPLPVWNDLSTELKIGTVTGAVTTAWIAARFWRWQVPYRTVSLPVIVLLFGWWLIDPLALYGYSRVSGNSVFVPRYLYLAIPGVILTALLIVSTLIPMARLKQSALVLGIAVLLFTGHWNRLWPAHTRSDWRAAATALNSWIGSEDVPVVCPSPFIEARPPAWSPDTAATGFLYSHLAFYPIGGHSYAFPYEASPEAEAHARQLSSDTLVRAGRWAIYGGDHAVTFWRDWFSARPEFDSWQISTISGFGDVEIVVFTSPTVAPAPARIRPRDVRPRIVRPLLAVISF